MRKIPNPSDFKAAFAAVHIAIQNRMEGTLILILVVAEKPSVAMSYAKVLGATNRQDGYLEGKHSNAEIRAARATERIAKASPANPRSNRIAFECFGSSRVRCAS